MRSLFVGLMLLLPLAGQEQVASVVPESTATIARVDAPSVAKRDRPVRINHPKGAKVQAIYADVSTGTVVWSYMPEEHFERDETYTSFAAPPGDYLITIGDSTILRIVEEGGPRPNPNPNPGPSPGPEPGPPDPEPEPEPEPGPKLKVNYAVWIYEQTDAINQIPQTNTRLSIETQRYLESRGIKKFAYDDEQDAAKPFSKVVESLPALILMQEKGKYLAFPAPSSLDELKKLVEEVSGE